jgi:hypothetical protein
MFETVAPGVGRLGILFVNVFALGEPGGPWLLIDAGLPGSAGFVRRAVARRFGAEARPRGFFSPTATSITSARRARSPKAGMSLSSRAQFRRPTLPGGQTTRRATRRGAARWPRCPVPCPITATTSATA